MPEVRLIDADPAKHGRWIEVSRNITYPASCDIAIKCSLCGHHEIIPLFRKDDLRFCSWCGAKMEEPVNGGAENG